MKKLLVLAGMVALIATSCSKDFSNVEIDKSNETAIGFSQFTENSSRAGVEALSFDENDTFKVYGTKTVDATTSNVFDGYTVTKGVADWSYVGGAQTLKYWDKGASKYNFFAYSPATATATYSTAANNGLFSFASVTFAGNDNDLLVAESNEVAKANFGSTVDLSFRHVASLVDVKIKKAAALAGDVAITNLSIKDAKNSGSYAVTGYAANKPAGTWTPEAGTANYAGNAIATVTTTAAVSIEKLIVMPQTLNDANTIDITYTINGDTYNRSIKLTSFDTVDNTVNNDPAFASAWEQGKRYTYTLTINADAITFDASIATWDNVNGFYYLND